MSLAIALASAASGLQAASPTAQNPSPTAEAAAGDARSSVPAQLSTVVDHGNATLAQHHVVLPTLRVTRIVSPAVVELRDARERGGYRFHHWKDDRLLAVLPAGAKVQKGDQVLLSGVVRTVRGAALTGTVSGLSEDQLRDWKNRVLLVATTVTTPDGVPLR
jgi:hypothetical protein